MAPQSEFQFDNILFTETLKSVLRRYEDDNQSRGDEIDSRMGVASGNDPFSDNDTLFFELAKCMSYWLVRLWPGLEDRSRPINFSEAEKTVSPDSGNPWMSKHQPPLIPSGTWDRIVWPSLLPTSEAINRMYGLLETHQTQWMLDPNLPYPLITTYIDIFQGCCSLFDNEPTTNPQLTIPGTSLFSENMFDTESLLDLRDSVLSSGGKLPADNADMHFLYCYLSYQSFSVSDRVSGYEWLQEAIGCFPSPWCLAYLDHQIEESSNSRANLSYDEWNAMFRSCMACADAVWTPTGDDHFGNFISLETQSYWAWRFGFTAALGHQWPDNGIEHIKSLEGYADFHLVAGFSFLSEPVKYVLSDPHFTHGDNVLLGNPGLSLATDLILSMGEQREWGELRERYIDVYLDLLRIRREEHLDEIIESSGMKDWTPPYLPKHHSDTPIYWLIRIGYTDGRIYLGGTVPLTFSNRTEGVGSLEGQTILTEQLDRLEQIIASVVIPNSGLIGSDSQFYELSTISAKQILPENIFSKFPPHAIREIGKAELHFNQKFPTPGWEKDAEQGYTNTAEALIQTKLMEYLRNHPVWVDRFGRPGRQRLSFMVSIDLLDRLIKWHKTQPTVRGVWSDSSMMSMKDQLDEIKNHRPWAHPYEDDYLPNPDLVRTLLLGTLVGSQDKGLIELLFEPDRQ